MTPSARQPDQVQTFNNGAYANWGQPVNMKANTVPGTALPPAPDPMQNPLARGSDPFTNLQFSAQKPPASVPGGLWDAQPGPAGTPETFNPNAQPSGGAGTGIHDNGQGQWVDALGNPMGVSPSSGMKQDPNNPNMWSVTAPAGTFNNPSPGPSGTPESSAPQSGQSDQARLLAGLGFSPAQVAGVTGGSAPAAAPPPPGVTTFQNMYQNAGTLPQGTQSFPTQGKPITPGVGFVPPAPNTGTPPMYSGSQNSPAGGGVQTFQNGAYATQGNGQAQPSGGITPPKMMDTGGSMLPPGTPGVGAGSPSTGVNGNGQISGVPGMPLGQVQGGINTSNVPSLVGGDALSSQMNTAQQAAYKQATGYLDPQFANEENALRNQLVNQGVPQNSEAWNKAMDDFNRQKTFAYQQAQSGAVQQGNQAQAQLFGQGLAANQNQFGQNAAAGSFTNSAQQQQVQQILQSLGFNEGVNQNNFNNSMGMRQQDLNELLMQQQNPLQMFQALSGGNNVGAPQFPQVPGATVGGTDIASIIAQALAQQNNVYNSQVGATNSANSGTASIAAAVIAGLLSDRRLKKNVRMIGMHEAGVPLYSFDYVWDKPGIGVMADELKHVMPDAVFTTPSGYEAVDYAKLSRVE